MLNNLSVTCPKCHQRTDIAVSDSEGGDTAFASTACRQCHARLLTGKQPDGRVLILDFDRIGAGSSAQEALLAV